MVRSLRKMWLAVVVAAVVMFGAAGMAYAVDPPNWVAALYVEAQKMIGLRWMPVAGATGYKVLRSETAGSGYAEIGTTAAPQYFDKEFEPGTTYYYVLQAVAGAEVSPNSGEKSITIPGEKKRVEILPPEWRKVNVQQKTEFGKTTFKVGLLWVKDPSPAVVAYNVYRSETAGKDYSLVGSVAEDQFVDTNVEKDKTYYYVVTALDNQFKETAHSDEKSVTLTAAKAKKEKIVLPNPPLQIRGSRQVQMIKSGEGVTLGSVSDLVVDSDGNIYASDISTATIKVFNDEGEFIREIGEKGKETGKILYPLGLGIDSDDNIYIADRGVQSRIVVLDPKGRFIKELIVPGPTEEMLAQVTKKDIQPIVKDVAVGPDGRIYTTDNAINRLLILDEDGEMLKEIGGPGTAPGMLNAPGWLAINAAGEVHVTNGFNRRIEVFNLDGEFVRNYGKSKTFIGSFIGATGVTFDADGNSIITDASIASIQFFDPEGNYLFHVGNETADIDTDSKQRAQIAIRNPGGIVYHPDNDYIYFSLSMDKTIMARQLTDLYNPPKK